MIQIVQAPEGQVIELDDAGIDHMISSMMDLSAMPEGEVLDVFGIKFRKISE